jgi:hypothetical protein
MKEHQQRVKDEKIELDYKREKLREFLYTDTFAKLNDGERGLLSAQYIIMGNYSDILQTRVEGFLPE